MRHLAIALLFALFLSTAAATPTRQWTPPCFTMTAAHDADYFRIIQNMQAGAGWSLSSTVPVSMTLTHVVHIDNAPVITTTVSTLDRALYTITDNDLEARFDGADPFVLYHCAPGVNPHYYLPIVLN